MDRIARIDKTALTGGLFLDQKQQVSPLWVDGNNVIFNAGTIAVFPGSVPLFIRDATTPITGISELSSIVLANAGICFGNLTDLNVWDPTNGIQNVGTGYGGIISQSATMPATRWSIQQWNEWIVATNGYNPMQLCKDPGVGFADMTSDTDSQFKLAEIIRKYRQLLVAFDLTLADGTRQPNAAAWCDVNDVETWVPAADNSAKKIFIPDLESSIKAVEKLGDILVMYSDDSAYALPFTGYPDVFEPIPLQAGKGFGAYGKNCVAAANGIHYGIGSRGIWKTDGSTFEYIDTPAVKKYLAQNMNLMHTSKCVVYYDKLINHLCVFYPENGQVEPSAGLALNVLEPKWTKMNFGRTVAIDSGVLAYGVTGDASGNVYRQSLDQVPASGTDAGNLGFLTSGEIRTGYGEGGYGEGGYGGVVLV